MSERKVSTDALETLGTIIGEGEKRDAIHLAVLPVVATMKLHAGDHVGLVPDGATSKTDKHIGVVDPFLDGPVHKGERFWLVIYPRKINSLRHVWSHPDVDDADEPVGKPSAKSASEVFLSAFADEAGLTLAALIEGARDYISTREYMVQGGRWEGFSIPDGFWDHYQAYTGETVAEDDRDNFFSCSC